MMNIQLLIILNFLEKYKINLSITTYNSYKRICNKYIIPLVNLTATIKEDMVVEDAPQE